MKAKYFLRNKIQQAALVLVLVTTLVATSALAAEGALDPTFGTNGVVTTDLGGSSDTGVNIVLQPDGKIVMAGSGSAPVLARYNLDGTLDATFGTGGKLTTGLGGPVALQADGKLIVGGDINNGFGLARYTSSGILDTTFGTNGVTTFWENENSLHANRFGDLVVQPNGKILVVGLEDITDGNHVYCLAARLDENGVRGEGESAFFDEGNFPSSERNYCKAAALQSDGKIIISGMAEPNEGGVSIILGRLLAGPGVQLDPTFGTNGHGTVLTPLDNLGFDRIGLAIQANNKIVIAGTVYDYNNHTGDLFVARYNSNGTLDTTFAGSGIVITDFGEDEAGNDVAVQRDGKIVVAGRSSSSLLLVRYNSNGSLDTTFGDAGKVISTFGGSSASAAGIALQVDGKILAAGGKDGDALLVRYNGTLPPTTTATFNSKAAADGWILESAEFSNIGGTLDKTATTFNVGDDPKDKQYRSIISFNTVALPDNAFITSAQVKIKRQGVVGTDPFTTHGNLLLDIRNGLFSNDLDVKLSDFAAAPSSNTPDTITPLTSSWYAANLSSSNLVFVNKYGVTQFRLRFNLDDNDDLSADYLKFFTGESTTANQPQLIVTYVLP